MNASSSEDATEVRLGPDLVRIENGVLVIYSPRNMDDWVVREFRRPVIWFRGYSFHLRSKTRADRPFAWKYTLWARPDDDHESVPYVIDYNEDYVRDREEEWRANNRWEWRGRALLPLYPLAGFMWSGSQAKLEDRGWNVRRLVGFAVYLEFTLVLLFGIFIGWLGGFSFPRLLLLMLVALDVIFRYDAILRDKPRLPGFYEWLFRRL